MKVHSSLFFLLLVSCGTPPQEDKETKKTTGPKQIIVGRIASVSKRGKFVLIQKLGTGTLPEGIIYQSRGPDGRTASLRPSGERVRDFFAADLLSGDAEKSDAVIAYENPDKKDDGESRKNDPDGESDENVCNGGLPKDDQDPQTIRDSG